MLASKTTSSLNSNVPCTIGFNWVKAARGGSLEICVLNPCSNCNLDYHKR